MRRSLLVIVFFIYISSLNAQQLCATNILVQYDTIDYTIEKHGIVIMFNSGFEGFLEISINNKLIEQKNITYVPSIDNTDVQIFVSRRKLKKGCLLYVRTATGCMQIPLDWRYKSLRINKAWNKDDNANWYLIYTDNILVRE